MTLKLQRCCAHSMANSAGPALWTGSGTGQVSSLMMGEAKANWYIRNPVYTHIHKCLTPQLPNNDGKSWKSNPLRPEQTSDKAHRA